MRTAQDVTELLDRLEKGVADDLEDQDLDFKQWDSKSRDNAVKTLVQMADGIRMRRNELSMLASIKTSIKTSIKHA